MICCQGLSRKVTKESLMFTGISAPHLSELTCHSCHSNRVGGTVMPLTFNFFFPSLLLMKPETLFVQPTVRLLVFLRKLLLPPTEASKHTASRWFFWPHLGPQKFIKCIFMGCVNHTVALNSPQVDTGHPTYAFDKSPSSHQFLSAVVTFMSYRLHPVGIFPWVVGPGSSTRHWEHYISVLNHIKTSKVDLSASQRLQ